MATNALGRFRAKLWHLRHDGIKGLVEHQRRLSAVGSEPSRFGATISGGASNRRRREQHTSMDPWTMRSENWQARHAVNVAIIADTFSELAFKFEWNQHILKPSSWQSVFSEESIDLLFVESAWHGTGAVWKGMLTGANSPGTELKNLVQHCNHVGIPTVFWNKEDPAHFEDFLDTAALFDYVYTTDINKVPEYIERLGHSRVKVLPFAAQQSIHNPVRPPGWEERFLRDAAFAGTYFRHKYPERREQMETLIGGTIRAIQRTRGTFDIFSRFAGVDPNYKFPQKWQRYVRAELSYPQMLTAYRSHRAFLNVNSVVGSPSMCARRIFEITACGTPVVSAPSEAIDIFFPGGGVVQAESEQEAYDSVRALVRSAELRDRLTAVGQREIWLRHTYTHRVNQILSDTGLGHKRSVPPAVSAMISTNRPQQLAHVLGAMSSQQGVDLEVLLLCHGFDLSCGEKADLEREYGPIRWLRADTSTPLGECYNILARAASGRVVAKIDDDDLYGPYYLFEALAAMDYAGADIVGKGAHYVYLQDQDATVLRFPEGEHKYRDFVSGPTIVAKRSAVLENPFEQVWRGEDTSFLRNARDNGAVIFSSNRFGFIQVRSGKGHTWSIEDREILATGRLFSYGLASNHVIF